MASWKRTLNECQCLLCQSVRVVRTTHPSFRLVRRCSPAVGVDRSLGSGEGARIASLPGRRSLSAYSSDEHPRQDGAACQVTHTINEVHEL